MVELLSTHSHVEFRSLSNLLDRAKNARPNSIFRDAAGSHIDFKTLALVSQNVNRSRIGQCHIWNFVTVYADGRVDGRIHITVSFYRRRLRPVHLTQCLRLFDGDHHRPGGWVDPRRWRWQDPNSDL